MADFCQECSDEMFGEDFKDLAALCADGETVEVLCEGCGFITVDWLGKRVGDKPTPDETRKKLHRQNKAQES